MRYNAWPGLFSTILAAAIGIAACGDTEQQPTGATGGTTTTTAGGGGTTMNTGGHTTHPGGGGTGGTTGGTGGTGGAPECTAPEDCGISDDCHSFTCDMGVCSDVFAASGTKTSAQSNGDCKVNVCDGDGMIVVEDDELDVFDDQNDCTDDVCVGGAPMNDAVASGTACTSDGGKLCDGAKACVECLVNVDCNTGVCTLAHTCAPAMCGDGVKNGQETDLDCGGAVCGQCPVGKTCGVGLDCIEGVCDLGTLKCAAPTCGDMVENGVESDVDCGGAMCMPCITGKKCAAPSDCVDLVCSGVPLTCQMSTCSDSTKNGAETDMDCGGPSCPDCANGKLCSDPNDCVSGVCSGVPEKCQVPTCMDGVENGLETGLDCGGLQCGDCPNGQGCNVDGDCASGFCNAAKLCAMPTCNDGAKNGAETDVDCGGPTCMDCTNGKLCNSGADCTSTYCYGVPPSCQPDLNGCTLANAISMTGQANVTITFTSFVYTPACLKVSAGTNLTFSGAFMSHPLVSGTVSGFDAVEDMSGPFYPQTSTGTMKTFPSLPAGEYPYYCAFHYGGGMKGAVFVVP